MAARDDAKDSKERARLLAQAKELEAQGRIDVAVRTFLQAEARDEAARVLSGQRRYLEAAEALLSGITAPLATWGTLDPTRKKHALMAAIHLQRANEGGRAVEIFLVLGERQRAAETLRKLGDHVGAAKAEAGQLEASVRLSAAPSAYVSSAGGGPLSLAGARSLEQKGRLDAALEQYTSLRAYGDAARVANALGRTEFAAELYMQAGLPFEAAQVLLSLGDLYRAFDQLLRVPRVHPEYRAAAMEAVRTATSLDVVSFEFESFLTPFVRTAPLSEAEAEALYALARLYERHRYIDNAREALAKIATLAPGWRDVTPWLARLDESLRTTGVHDEQALDEQVRFWNSQRGQQQLEPSPLPGLAELPTMPDLPPLPSAHMMAMTAVPGMPLPPGALAPAPATHFTLQPQAVHHTVDPAVSQMARATMPPTAPAPSTGATLLSVGSGAPVSTPPPSPAPAPSAAPSSSSSSGAVFEVGGLLHGRYRLEKKIGEGGMAMVFRAMDEELGEHVAIKVFTQPLRDPNQLARFRQELKLARQLRHPNIVQLYDIGIVDDYRYLSMELLVGEDLFSRAQKGLTLKAGLGFLIQACAGLQCAHDKGVVHRDVKSENFFVTQEEVLKVLDFGIAKQQDAKLTQMGMLAGTPHFISPEQINSFGTVGPAADIYSLGVVAYQLCTGRVPFDHTDIGPILIMHLTKAPEPPRALNPSLSPELDALILSCLEKDPARRPGSCRELASRLTLIRDGVPG